MRGKPDAGEMPDVDAESKKKRVDLSLPQVAGSAVAAVVAAKLASYFGVYGTILGAGLVSVVATCGGTLFQHFFKRTGEQIREVTVPPKPRSRQAPAEGQFTEGTVYRARVRSWKRPVVAAALVFGVTMAGITTYELVSGQSFSGDGRSTTVGDAFQGSGGSGSDSEPGGTPSPSVSSPSSSSSATPSGGSSESGQPSGGGTADDDSGATTPTPTPSSGADSEAGDDDTVSPTPSATATTPAPDASSRSQSADQDQADPAAR
ncbi:hypothetical protein AB5J56_12520 [Streptomyces sp. R21]|uniref:Uncharacterized protein n=1 Tax=Streptomyces sp. R21 TaxID=3238627 RepID=A0AB39P8R1_9ACTN